MWPSDTRFTVANITSCTVWKYISSKNPGLGQVGVHKVRSRLILCIILESSSFASVGLFSNVVGSKDYCAT